MKSLLSILIMIFAIMTSVSGQKGVQSFSALKIDAKTTTTLLKSKVKTEAFVIKNNELHVMKGYKIIFDKKSGSYVFLKEKEDFDNYPVMSMDGTMDIGGGLALRCASDCSGGCDPGANSGPDGTVYFCSSCPGSCMGMFYVPKKKVQSLMGPEGDWSRPY